MKLTPGIFFGNLIMDDRMNRSRMNVAMAWMACGVLLLAFLVRPAGAERIRDVAHLKNEVPNEIVGVGLVTGLEGTGDGGDFLPAMRPLMEMMKHFDDHIAAEKELKNAKNVAIVVLRA